MKKILIQTAFLSVALNRTINENEVIEADEEYQEKLKSKGIKFIEYKEDEKSLLEKYMEDRNIVDDLKAEDLKLLCKDLDIEYTKADEIKEHLKTMEILEDK